MVTGNVDGNRAVNGHGGGIFVSVNESEKVSVGIYGGSVSSHISEGNGGALAVAGEKDGTKKISVQIGVQLYHFDEERNVICDHDVPNVADETLTGCPQLNGNRSNASGGGI